LQLRRVHEKAKEYVHESLRSKDVVGE
jgi:hypothetical protein